MKIDDKLEDFRKGKFELDFIQISLNQLGGSEPKKFFGPGAVRQDEHGQISIKCHASSLPIENAVDLFNDQMNRQSGELFLDEDYYSVEARHMSHGMWSVDRTLIDTSWSMPLNAGTVSAAPRSIQHQSTYLNTTRNELKLIFFEQKISDWKFLLNQERTFEIAKQVFTITASNDLDNQIVLLIKSDGQFPNAFERRLLEAMQFVLCKDLYPAISDFSNGELRSIELYAGNTRRLVSPVLSPIPINSIYYSGPLVELLGAYINHLYEFEDEGMWHSNTNFLTLARNASSMSLDAWAIGLCVAVEGLASTIPYSVENKPAEHKKARDGIAMWMKQEDISVNLAKRIEGFLSQLDHIRPQDRMLSLTAAGEVREADINTWKSLRNRSVHTKRAGEADLEDEKIQRNIDDTYKVLSLMHMLIFQRIGYVGPFTDFGVRGWPESCYPLKSREGET